MSSDHQSVLTQLRRGVLEYCVLATMSKGPIYGLELAQALSKNEYLVASEGTLYPLLSRLRKQGLIESTWQESPNGPPRRYYQLSPTGESALAAFTQVWGPFQQEVSSILKESQ